MEMGVFEWRSSNPWNAHEAHAGGMNQCQPNLDLCTGLQRNCDAEKVNGSNGLCSCCAGAANVYRDGRPQLSSDPSSAKYGPI